MDANVLFRKAQELFTEGKNEESVKIFTDALEEGYDFSVTYLSRGAAYIMMQDYKSAIADFDRALESGKDKERSYYYRGVAYMNISEYERALSDLNETIRLNPNRGAAIFARAIVNAELGKEEDSAQDFKTAMMYSELEVQKFADAFGIWRTKFHKTFALLEGERGPVSKMLNDKMIGKIKKWMEE